MNIRNRFSKEVCILLSLLAFVVFFAASDSNLKPVPENMRIGFESINAAEALSFVEFLAADELEGRDTSSNGLRIARNYVKSLYKIWGISPAGDTLRKDRLFDQRIRMIKVTPGTDNYLEIISESGLRKFMPGSDLFMGRANDPGLFEAPVVFAGYGISAPDLGYDDLAGIEVKGKIVLIMMGVPGGDMKESPFTKEENRARFNGYSRLSNLSSELGKKGALAALMVQADTNENTPTIETDKYIQGKRIRSRRNRMIVPALEEANPAVPFTTISKKVADYIFSTGGKDFSKIKHAIDSTLKPSSSDISGIHARLNVDASQEPLISGNVLGMIEGSDPILKEEFVVIGAHLDHEGDTDEGYVFNGADDNASGSAGVLAAAKAFALNPVKPKRSILFAHWTGEEKGLYGSRYFVEFPTIPRDKIVAYINLDMIGRDMPVEIAKRSARMFGMNSDQFKLDEETMKNLFISFSSAQSPLLSQLIKQKNDEFVGLVCVDRSAPTLSGGSDHAPFHQNEIPSLGFITGFHDDYHTPTDTSEKINSVKLAKIAGLVYLVAYELAESPQRPEWKAVE